MATIDECYRLLKYRVTKSGFNGNISPDDFNLVFPRAEVRFFNSKYKTFQINQDNTDALIGWKTDPIPITIDATGKYVKPLDILHIDSIRHVFNGIQREVTRIEDDRLANHLSSSYDAPNGEFPIYTEYKTYLQFNPIDIATANLVYLQQIIPSKWGYTLVSGRPVYDPATSVQPRFDDADIDEILYMAMSDLGINMRDQMVDAFSERKIQTEK